MLMSSRLRDLPQDLRDLADETCAGKWISIPSQGEKERTCAEVVGYNHSATFELLDRPSKSIDGLHVQMVHRTSICRCPIGSCATTTHFLSPSDSCLIGTV